MKAALFALVALAMNVHAETITLSQDQQAAVIAAAYEQCNIAEAFSVKVQTATLSGENIVIDLLAVTPSKNEEFIKETVIVVKANSADFAIHSVRASGSSICD